jgi:hypothetical protein
LRAGLLEGIEDKAEMGRIAARGEIPHDRLGHTGDPDRVPLPAGEEG